MCLVLQSEVILANVLSHVDSDYGVDRDDLAQYCRKVKSELAKHKVSAKKYVYFDIDEQSVKDAIRTYTNQFVEVGDKIYGYRKINIDYFNSRLNSDISKTLERVAENYISEICSK